MTSTDKNDTPPISGRTAILTIVGHPVSQVRSPTTANVEFARTGSDAALVAVDLEPSSLPAFVQMLSGWQNSPGCIVTLPHKTAVDELTDRARLLGAVNIVRRTSSGHLVGDMIDGLGFLEALKRNGFEARGKHVAVFGAGAVGRALLLALADAGAGRISFHEPEQVRRASLESLASAAGIEAWCRRTPMKTLKARTLPSTPARSA